MGKRQFRVLYWQFLFRVVDFDLLSASAQGDASKLLGQFVALLAYVSAVAAIAGLLSGIGALPPLQRVAASWGAEQFLISTTMLVVGLFAVLSWDAMFPDRQDVGVLGPLPVRERTLFIAKAGAVATALLVAVITLNSLAGLIWPLALTPSGGGVLGAARSFVAYWIAMLGAGMFVFCFLLCAQGLSALLPRKRFLQASSALQLAAFCLLLVGYFWEPFILTQRLLSAPANQSLLEWVPTYWFWGLFQTIAGTTPTIFHSLAWRAAFGLAVAVFGASGLFLLSYLRTLRKTMEEPDIVPTARSGQWSPRFGDAPFTALVHFSLRTLFAAGSTD